MSSEIVACAVETSSRIGSVALQCEGRSQSVRFEKGMRHGRELMPQLKRLLDESGLTVSSLELVISGLGPGSYTGLRIGVIAARSLAYALDCDILGVASHDALAWCLPGELRQGRTVVTVSDARRGAVYFARFRDDPLGRPLDGHRLAAPDELERHLPADSLLVGPGLSKFGERLRTAGFELAPEALWVPTADAVLGLGLARYEAGERAAIGEVSPLYLRESVPGWTG